MVLFVKTVHVCVCVIISGTIHVNYTLYFMEIIYITLARWINGL